MSFSDVRDVLCYAYYDGLISDEEFLLLFEEYESTNPCFPYWEYNSFSLVDLVDSEAKAEFRIEKADIPAVADALNLPDFFRCNQGTSKLC